MLPNGGLGRHVNVKEPSGCYTTMESMDMTASMDDNHALDQAKRDDEEEREHGNTDPSCPNQDHGSSAVDATATLYHQWIEDAIGTERDYASVSLGVWRQGKPTITLHVGERHPPDNHSLYEIGSITKLFTTLLLALAVLDQDHNQTSIHLDTPVVDLLPAATFGSLRRFPRQITLERLATHTSGLPRLPTDWNFYWNLMWHQENPYSAYRTKNLVTTLKKYRDADPQDIGSGFAYSNLGMGLLGYALSCNASSSQDDSAGMAFENVLRKRILDPLQLNETFVAHVVSSLSLSDENLLPGYNKKGQPVKHWTFDAVAGCGALRSTLPNLLQFGIANVQAAQQFGLEANKKDQPCHGQDLHAGNAGRRLDWAMHTCHQERFVMDNSTSNVDYKVAIGLGWMRTTRNDGSTLIWHNGGTYGFSSYLGFEPETGIVVVLLANTPSVFATTLGAKILHHTYREQKKNNQSESTTS